MAWIEVYGGERSLDLELTTASHDVLQNTPAEISVEANIVNKPKYLPGFIILWSIKCVQRKTAILLRVFVASGKE